MLCLHIGLRHLCLASIAANPPSQEPFQLLRALPHSPQPMKLQANIVLLKRKKKQKKKEEEKKKKKNRTMKTKTKSMKQNKAEASKKCHMLQEVKQKTWSEMTSIQRAHMLNNCS